MAGKIADMDFKSDASAVLSLVFDKYLQTCEQFPPEKT